MAPMKPLAFVANTLKSRKWDRTSKSNHSIIIVIVIVMPSSQSPMSSVFVARRLSLMISTGSRSLSMRQQSALR